MLKSTNVTEAEIYPDEEIAGWDKEDRLEAIERDAILKNLRSALSPPVPRVSEILDSITKSKNRKKIRRKR